MEQTTLFSASVPQPLAARLRPRTLEEYESKLRLMEKFLHIKGSAEEILKLACREEGTAVEETMERIRVLSTDILEEL